MEVEISILNAFMLTCLELLFEGLGQHVFIGSGFLEEVDEYHKAVITHHAAQMLIEWLLGQVMVSLQRSMSLEPFLLPE
jgi:hypothetical protein